MSTLADHTIASAQRTLDRALRHLDGRQDASGYWCGELESNSSIAAEQVFLLRCFGRGAERDLQGLGAEILATRNDEGGWSNWHGGPTNLSTTVEAYYALRLLGHSADEPALAQARRLVHGGGGANQARFFTKLWLAVLGQFPYSALPSVPPEAFLIPHRSRFSPVSRLASWARGTFVPIMVVLSEQPTHPQPVGCSELFLEAPGAVPGPGPKTPGPWTRAFALADRLARVYDRHPLRPLRRIAHRRIARWIVERQEADGSWGGIQPPWVYSLLALRTLGYPLDHPVLQAGLDGFEAFTIRDGDRSRVQACVSPVWDTALAMVARADAGVDGADPGQRAAVDWLLAKEVRLPGDWALRARGLTPGGWAFEFANDWYPDTDDTAEVVIALVKAGVPSDHPAIRRAIDWLLGMQSRDGGWGAFDVDSAPSALSQHAVCDFGEVADPATEDVTAHVIEALALVGMPPDDPAIRRGVDFLWRTQRADGSWWGRWGVNHIYGTGAAVPALVAAGVDPRDSRLRRAVGFLAMRQNPDGGWGEDVASYADPTLAGRGPSTASQTAWALLALIAADPGHAALGRGIAYLAETQNVDGSWDERAFTGTGFPLDFMINYHLYRLYFPITALGRYLA